MPATPEFQRTVTLYGRMPVLEALLDDRARIITVWVARNAQGQSVDRILEEVGRRGISLEKVEAKRITAISRNGRHDQGVVARVAAPGLADLDEWLGSHGEESLCLMLLDGLTNPANVGMIVRTSVAAGLDGVVLPRTGSPDVGPLVVKASAGIALFAPIMQADTAAGAARSLAGAGVSLIGLRSSAASGIWNVEIAPRTAFVVGNESFGISAAVSDLITTWCSIPLSGGVESLNVASAATLAAFEVARRRTDPAVDSGGG